MGRFGDLTVNDIARALSRYRPYLLVLLGVFVLAVVIPGTRTSDDADLGTAAGGTFNGTGGANGELTDGEVAAGEDGLLADGTYADGTSTGSGTTRSGARGQATHGVLSAGVAKLGNPADAPDCDKGLGRVAVPSVYAPNCVGLFSGSNGGSTYQGVTEKEIVVAYYEAELSAAAQAIAQAGGATDDTSEEEDHENRVKSGQAFEAHFETYGRKVKWVRVDASGKEDDDAAAKADAIKIATEIKAFAVMGGPSGTNAFADELAARGVLCLCTASQPIENYLRWAPYVWSGLMASSQGYIHRSEYVCKRLAGKNAKWAGDPTFQAKQRTFALVYYDTADHAYKAGADFMEKLLAQCGVKLAIRLATKGAHIDTAGAQDEARTYAARLKESGATSVLFAGDPFYPIFLTKESTNQNYFPEWIITGSTLSDTAFFARLYDQQQWSHAFGISFLTARVAEEVEEREKNLIEWHFGQELTSYPDITVLQRLYTGVHLAGPNLNPQTFRDGLFSFKPTKGFITRFGVSYGRGLWPWDDYLAADDTAEIWWDATVRGPSETNTDGVGLYRYVDMGKRYLPGEWPNSEPRVFDPANTSLIYDERPAQDRDPQYPHHAEHVRGPKK